MNGPDTSARDLFFFFFFRDCPVCGESACVGVKIEKKELWGEVGGGGGGGGVRERMS